VAISEEDVRRVAALAQLELAPEETERLARDLGAFLAYVERVDLPEEPDTEDEPATTLREDRAEPWLLPGEAVRDAPGARDGLFRVPPAIEG